MANQSVHPAESFTSAGNDKTQQLLEHFLAELDETYPDGTIDMRLWDHEHWDRPAKFLMQQLGYQTGREFLEDQGFVIRTQQRHTAEQNRVGAERSGEAADSRSGAGYGERRTDSGEHPPAQQRRRPPETEERRRVYAGKQTRRGPVKFNAANAVLLLVGAAVFVVGVVILMRGIGQMQSFL